MLNNNEYYSDQPKPSLFSVCILAIFIASLFYFSGHNIRFSLKVASADFVSESQDFLEQSMDRTSHGSRGRQIAFSLLGLYGLHYLVFVQSRRPHLRGAMGRLVVMLLAWAIASLFWTVDFALTTRRLIALLSLVLGALAVEGRFPRRQLVFFALIVSGVFVAIGFVAELLFATFDPVNSWYRFSGSMHPNSQGLNCAIMLLAATATAQMQTGRRGKALEKVAIIALIFLLLTKSRTSTASGLIALLVFWNRVVVVPKKTRFVVVIVIMFLGLFMVLGEEFIPSLQSAILFGRNVDEGASHFAGRVPLFGKCFEYFVQRPFVGYGYGAFWDPDHIADVTDFLGWPTAAAHSVYIDFGLDLGLIGLGLLLTLVGGSLLQASVRHRKTGDPVYAFFLAILVMFTLDGLLESILLTPSFPLFVMMLVILSLARPDPRLA